MNYWKFINGEFKKVKPTKYHCPRCHGELYESDINGYAFQCFECDEDFYEIEVNKNEN